MIDKVGRKMIRLIAREVRRAEEAVMARRGLPPAQPGESNLFKVGDKREELYEATQPYTLQAHFDELTLPGAARYASWGAGLGMDGFVAAFNFLQVTMYEIDAELCERTEAIRRMFGLDNVEIINGDFLDLSKAELDKSHIVYFYRPFRKGFFRLVGEKLQKTRPETIVISHYFYDQELFPAGQYKLLHPRGWPLEERSINSEFFTFKRK